jgi:hypothetical protein
MIIWCECVGYGESERLKKMMGGSKVPWPLHRTAPRGPVWSAPRVTVYDRHTHSTSNPTERPPRFGRYGRTVGFRTGTAYGRPMSVWTAKSTAEQ